MILPSKEQQAIINRIKTTTDNLVVTACAGSGKTSTLRMICENVEGSCVALCFNRKTAEDFSQKLPSSIYASTLHSLGFAIIRKNSRNPIEVKKHKTHNICRDHLKLFKRYTNSEAWNLAQRYPRLISLVRSQCVDPNDIPAIRDLCDQFEIQIGNDDLFHVAPILQKCRETRGIIDYDDMIDHPVVHDVSMPYFDTILIDEAQDLSPQQILFIEKLAQNPDGKDSRIIAVGDPDQSIYAFRGADATAMQDMIKRFGLHEMPLTVSFRCSVAVVEQAQEVVGEERIVPAPFAELGHVEHRIPEDLSRTLKELEPGDLVVCRTNAPIVKAALQLLSDDVPAVIRGWDFKESLLDVIKSVQERTTAQEIDDFIHELISWAQIVYNQMVDEGRYRASEGFMDKIDCMVCLASSRDVTNVEELKSKIESLFQSENGAIELSTIHRAKGHEARRVIFLAPELVPHPMVFKFNRPESLRQERNLDYVARTRAKNTLIYQPIKEVVAQ